MNLKLLLWPFLSILMLSTLHAYNPPLGIPNPSDWFDWEIDRETPEHPDSWTASPPTETENFYYVDNTHPQATDAGNPYGHPDKPRATIPEGLLQPGAFVYVHAGTYTSISGSRLDWHGAGTSANPIWITGNAANRPTLGNHTGNNVLVEIGEQGSASYFIFENFIQRGTAGIVMRASAPGRTVDHVIIRKILRVGNAGDDDTAVNIGSTGSTDPVPQEGLDVATISDIVVYDCVFHSIGDFTVKNDIHGVTGGYHTDRVWVLDSEIYNCSGDSVQAGHRSNYDTRRTRNWYVGRNKFYGNGENGVDFKPTLGFVISENEIYGPFAFEGGAAIVIHYGANTNYHPKDGAIIFNNIYTCGAGIATGFSSGVDNLEIVGNRFRDIKRAHAPNPSPASGACIHLDGTTPNGNSIFRIVDNTFHDYDQGLIIAPDATDQVKIHGNIFSARSDAAAFELKVDNANIGAFSLDYNFYTTPPAFRWANGNRTLDYMRTAAMQDTHSRLGDALFEDAANGDFRLQPGSPAIDTSVEGPVGDSVYAAFEAKFGLPIKVDYTGRARPVDGVWDFGAIESALPPDAAPTNLTVSQ